MTLSIIILSWNDRALVVQCVQSILDGTTGLDFELIVIDNASSDDSVLALEKFGNRIRLIKNSSNRGYAGGNNQGAMLARGDYILLLNQDVVVSPGTIATLVHWLQQQPDYGAATVTLHNLDGSVQYYMHRRFPTIMAVLLSAIHKRWRSFQPQLVRDYLYLDQAFSQDFDIEQAAGTCILLRRSLLPQIGGLFDERHFPLYYNDVDFCYRLWQAGYKIRCLTNVSLTHYKGTSLRRVPKFKNSSIYFRALTNYFFFLRRSRRSSGVK